MGLSSVPGTVLEIGVRPVFSKRRTDWTLGNTASIPDKEAPKMAKDCSRGRLREGMKG